jgi:LysM repeat protein
VNTHTHSGLVDLFHSAKEFDLKISKLIFAAAIFFLIAPINASGQQQQLTEGGMRFSSKSKNVLGFSQKTTTGSISGGFLQTDQTEFSAGSNSSQLNTVLNPLSSEGVVLRAGSPEDWKILVDMSLANEQSRKQYEKFKDEKSLVSTDITNIINQLSSGKTSLSRRSNTGEERLTQEANILLAILKANKKSGERPFLNGNTIIKIADNPDLADVNDPYWEKGLQVAPTIKYSSELKELISDNITKYSKASMNSRTKVEIVGFKLPSNALSDQSSGTISVAATSSKSFLSYTGKKGETLGIIAERFNVPIEDLMKFNNITVADQVIEGVDLKIASDPTIASSLQIDSLFPKTVKVNAAEYLSSIAQTIGLTSEQLIQAYPELKNPDTGLNARSLAQILGLSLEQLMKENPLITNSDASLGSYGLDDVKIPPATLASIAIKLGVGLNDLVKMNPTILDPYAPIDTSYSVKIPGNWQQNTTVTTAPILQDPKPFNNELEFVDYGQYTNYEVTYTIPKVLAPLFTNNLSNVFK